MVTIYFDPIEAHQKGVRETLEAAHPLRSHQELHPRCYPLLWASAAKKSIALIAGLVTPDRRQGKIEMGV